MKKDNYKTRVMFYKEKDSNDVFAFFPEEYYNIKLYGLDIRTCYAHLGQHSACHVDYLIGLEKAKEDEYEYLRLELEGLGYNLRILNWG